MKIVIIIMGLIILVETIYILKSCLTRNLGILTIESGEEGEPSRYFFHFDLDPDKVAKLKRVSFKITQK